MTDWLATLAQRLAAHDAPPLVRVVVVATRGSAPRDAGACMLVGATTTDGTIGGGHLEWQAMAIARELLAQGTTARLDRFTLGATLGQCCGGAVELWFERWSTADGDLIKTWLEAREQGACVLATLLEAGGAPHATTMQAEPHGSRPLQRRLEEPAALPAGTLAGRQGHWFRERLPAPGVPLWLFGAGHVAQALVRVLDGLPVALTWIDNRTELFSSLPRGVLVPAGSTLRTSDDPSGEVRSAPTGTHFLIMTHSHDLDYAICRAALARDDAASVGLIGSATKAARFRHRLTAQGLDASGLTCPIGSVATRSKLPAAIAVSVAAQLLERLEAQPAGALRPARSGAHA